MNKVFKVIWSEARNAYVVVSEIAKNHGSKSCSTKKLLAMLIATGVMTCASMAPAMAADPPAEALKHSTVTNGANITVTEDTNKDGGKEYKVALNNDITLEGDTDDFVSISGSKGTIWATGSVIVGSGVDGSVVMDGTTATVSGLGNTTTAYNGFANGKGKAATEEQLKEVATEAGKHSVVTEGANITVTPEQAEDGRMQYNVALKNDIKLAGDNDYTYVNISGSKGSVWASSSVAAGNVIMDGTTATVSGLGNTTTAYDGFATTGKAATEEQLKEVATEAGKHSVVTEGANITVTPEQAEDGRMQYNVALKNDIKLAGDNDYTYVNISGSKGSVWASSSVAAGNVIMDGTTATVSGLGNTTTAYDGFATTGKAATEEQLKEVATEAGKHSKVVNGNNTNVEETTVDGQKVYKVNLNNNIMVGDVTGKYVSISGTNGTIEATGAIATKDRVYADKGGKLADIDVTGNKISNGASSIVLDGSNVKVNDKVTIDQNGNIAGVNSLQTNALNSKYNLSVGTMAENGIMPFFVNSTGDFYAAHNKFHVDKDGKVTATAGEIGNVVLQNGVYYGHSTLQDGSLLLTDDNGNHSYIDAKSAKLGKVTVAEDGKISGVAAGAVTADSTDAVNGSQLHAVATEAGKHSKVVNGSNINVEEFDNDGQKIYKVNLNKDIMLGDLTGKNVSISGTNGTIETTGYIATKDRVYADKGAKLADIDVTGNTISNGGATLTLGAMGGMVSEFANGQGASVKLFGDATIINGKVNVYNDGRIAGVAAGINDNDAVNVGQLKEAVEAGNTDTHIKPGEYGVGADNTVNMDVVDKNGNKVDTVTIKDVAKASDVGDVNNIASDIKNQDGSHTTVVDAVNNLNNKVGDLNYVEGGKGNYVTNGENTTTSIGKLDKALKDVADTANQGWNLSTNGGEASKVAPGKTVDFSGDKNINISNDGTNVKVELNKDIDVDTVTANSVTTGQTVMNNDGLKVGKDVSVTATAVTAGKTSISDEGVKVGDNTYISDKGLNANGQYITNVKAGEADTDAVNYGQLKDTNNHIDRVENQVVNNTNRINKLGSRVNKVGAGAAALAALHPMDFDPDDKLTFSAGYGNYAGENAAAIGAYYRPDEKVMFSVAGTVGNGENMVNAGVSFALDRTNHVSNSRTALAREVIDLRGQLAVMGAKMAKMEKAFGMLDETKTKLFPDVPANHWAYEYIAKLAGNGYIEGYPDGNFGGDRLMTRYEFAAMLYRAIENGAALEEKIIKEFEPELGRIRVDRISGEDGDRDKIERVRVNDTKGERDHYGNKLAK